jgi:hypothetical protein
MRNSIGLAGVVGVVGWLATAHAQAPAPSPAFDGTYHVVSSTPVNQTYTDKTGRTAPCPNRKPGPLHIANGLARYTTATGYKVRGSVGSQGELALSILAPSGNSRPLDMTVSGNIDNTGTVRVRQTSNSCSYDFVWQRAS